MRYLLAAVLACSAAVNEWFGRTLLMALIKRNNRAEMTEQRKSE